MMKFISSSQTIRWMYLRIYSTCLITLSRSIADVDRTVMKKSLLKYEVGLCCLLKEKYDNGLHLPLPAAFHEVSISPTFYARLFRTKVLHKAFLYLNFRYELLWAKKYWHKCAYKMLVKLTRGEIEEI
jgi:hypothetical protein